MNDFELTVPDLYSIIFGWEGQNNFWPGVAEIFASGWQTNFGVWGGKINLGVGWQKSFGE